MKKTLVRNFVSSFIALVMAVSVLGTNGGQEKNEQSLLKKVRNYSQGKACATALQILSPKNFGFRQ